MAPNGTDGHDEPVPPPDLIPPGLPERPKLFWPLCGLGVLLAGVVLSSLVGLTCFGGIFGLPTCRTIDAYKIYNNGAGEVAGAFRVRKSVFNAIQSDGLAGACITAEYAAFNLPKIAGKDGKCSTDKDCHGPILDIAPYKGWESVCHTGEGTCWVRPGVSPPNTPVPVCNKSPNPRNDGWYYYSFYPVAGPFKLATLNGKIDDMPILNPDAKGKPLRMRLFACLGGVDTNGPPSPCADDPSNRLMKFGDVNTLALPQ